MVGEKYFRYCIMGVVYRRKPGMLNVEKENIILKHIKKILSIS